MVKLIMLHPDLVISKEAAIDRIGAQASISAEQKMPHYRQQIQVVRRLAHELCTGYQNCKVDDWCWQCSSGQNGRELYMGDLCLGCKLLVVDSPERARETKLVQLGIKLDKTLPTPTE